MTRIILKINPSRLAALSVICLLCLGSVTAQDHSARVYMDKGDSLFKSKIYAEAVTLYEKAVDKKGPDGLSDYFTGLCYYRIYQCTEKDSTPIYLLRRLDSARKYFVLSGYNEYSPKVFEKIAATHERIVSENWLYTTPVLKKGRSSVTHDLYFKIRAVERGGGDTLFLAIQAGDVDGLRPGMEGRLQTIQADNNDDFDRLTLRFGEVILVKCSTNFSLGYVLHPADSPWYNNPITGDVVRFRIKLDAGVYPGLLLKLSKNYELSKGLGSGLLYHPRDLLRHSSKEYEEQLFLYLAEKVSADMATLEEALLKDSTFTQPLTKGRYKDSTLLSLLLHCRPEYIKLFLCYASDFPGSYRGDKFALAQYLATWMMNNGPLGSTGLLYTLRQTRDTQQFRKTVMENKALIHKPGSNYDDYLSDWFGLSQEYSKNGFYNEARNIDSINLRVATILNDPLKLGYIWFSIGYGRGNESLYKESIEAYRKGIPYLTKINDVSGLGLIYNNIGFVYEQQDQYKSAIIHYKKALEYKLKEKSRDSTQVSWSTLAKSCLGIGNCYYNISRYDSAVTYYKRGAQYAAQSKDIAIKSDLATLWHWTGRSYEKTGDYAQALLYYEKEIPIRRQMGDEVKLADAYDYFAYSLSKIGDYDKAIENYGQAYLIKKRLNNIKGAGFSLSNIAQSFYSKDMYDTAISLHKQAIKLREEGGDSTGVAYCSRKLGSLYAKIGDPKQALPYLEASLSQYQRLKNNPDYTVSRSDVADVMSDLAEQYYDLKDYTTAIKLYAEADRMYLADSNLYSEAIALYNIGLCHYNMKNYREALKIQTEAYNLRKNIDDKPGMVRCLNELSVIAQFMDRNYPLAEKYLKLSVALARKTDSQSQLAYAFRNLGTLYSSTGDINRSNLYYDSSIALYQATGSISEVCIVKNYKGYNEISQGHFEKARAIYMETLDTARKIGNNSRIADSYSALCDFYWAMGEFEKALNLLDSTYALYSSLDNKWGIAGAYITYGNTWNSMGNYKKTMEYYLKSDSMYAILGDSLSRGTPINNMGTVYYFQGDYQNALRCFYSVYETLKRIDYKGDMLSTVLWNIGDVYYEEKIYPESEKWLTEGMKVAISTNSLRKKAGISFTLGKLRTAQMRYKEADSLLNFAYNTFTSINEVDYILESANALGKLYFKTGNYAKAKKYLEASIQTSHRTGSFKFLWEPLYYAAQINQKENNTKASSDMLKEAVDVIEKLKGNLTGNESSVKLFAKAGEKVKIYEQLVAQLLQQDQTSLAFYYLEKANIEGLKEQTRGGSDTRGGSSGNMNQDAAGEIRLKINGIYSQLVKERSKPEAQQNKEKIRSLEELMTVAEQNYQSFIDSVIAGSPDEQKNFSSSINPKDLDQARFDLPDEVAVIEFLATNNQLVIFVATNTNLSARTIEISKTDIQRSVNALYRQIVSKGDLALYQKNAEQLYNLLIGPIKGLLEGKTRLALVPTGSFYKLPFQALGTSVNGKYRYLVEDYEVYYINNIRFVQSQGVQLSGDMKVLAFGNCDNSLPYAEEEVKSIKTIFGNTDVYIKENATEDLAKTLITQYPIIHFATHGNLDPVLFRNSYLTMAPNAAKGEDGRLTIEEIRAIKSLRNCNLIVLSACNTAVNDESTEGWINNPAKEFITKGTRSVVASLWSVDDQATNDILKAFYAGLNNKKSKSASLRQAQVKLLHEEKYRHPYYWSAFELIGEWQ